MQPSLLVGIRCGRQVPINGHVQCTGRECGSITHALKMYSLVYLSANVCETASYV